MALGNFDFLVEILFRLFGSFEIRCLGLGFGVKL